MPDSGGSISISTIRLPGTLLLVALFLFAVVGGCRADLGETTRGVTAEEVIFGTHTDLSGPAAFAGVASTNGMRMRFREANEAGGVYGRRIRLIVEDSQYQVPRAVQAANKLLLRDRVFAVISAIGTPMNNAVLQQQLELQVPNLFPFTWARSMVEPFHPLKFTSAAHYYDQMRAGVKYFVEERGKQSVCLMYQDTEFGQEVLDAVLDQLAELDLELVSRSAHRPVDTDFSTPVARHREAGCDLVVLATFIRDTILPMATARNIGWEEVTFLGTVTSFDFMVSRAEGGVTEGLYAMTFAEPAYPDSDDPQVRDWIVRYRDAFGADPTPAAQFGYIHADLAILGLEQAGSDLTVESFIQGLESVQGYRDLFGGPEISFGPDRRQGSNESFLARVENGRWVRVSQPLSY